MSELVNETAALRRWLSEAALPLWWQTGVDRCRGRFHEAIGLDGSVQVQPRRARTIARMAFSCCEAGWPGWLV
jgi:mannose/cellobiose epimerase-like protein (N-acyl-D-glucosamine 2-epimerase family)